MIRFPYGIADFRKIRREAMFYLDRTRWIGQLERLGYTFLLLRPRRFGKSLWLDTLATYYDLRFTADFDTLFGGLDIAREPTAERGRYFVLRWDFSEVSARGDAEQLTANLHDYINQRIKDFLIDYEDHLPGSVEIEKQAPGTLRHLLARIRRTPYRLCLLIDEYDNFVNDIMVQDVTTYRAMFDKDGPFKEIFKSVKSATQGGGLERVFVTGVAPLALNDLTSGFNTAEDISHDPAAASLCGFREDEVRGAVETIAGARKLDAEPDKIITMMRSWYNGYRFSEDAPELVYNPTNALHFLKHLARHGKPPRQLHDHNLRTDRSKLTFIARTSAGAGVIEQLTEGNGQLMVRHIQRGFSPEDLLTRVPHDNRLAASLLYYMGMLTRSDDPQQLRIPNQVIRKLFLDRLLELFLPQPSDASSAERAAGASSTVATSRHCSPSSSSTCSPSCPTATAAAPLAAPSYLAAAST